MLSIQKIRHDPDFVIHCLESRGVIQAREMVEHIVANDDADRKLKTRQQALLHERNAKSQEIGRVGASSVEGSKLKSEVLKINHTIREIEAQLANSGVEDYLLRLPNLPDIDTPDGLDESGNRVVDVWVPDQGFTLFEKDHVDLGTRMGAMDFESAVKIAGSRNVVLRRGLARLERALGQWMLDENVKAGYEETQVPLLANPASLRGTGQLPKFEEDLYSTNSGMYLIPTAEVSLANLYRDVLLPDGRARRHTALTPCFRSEAGSAGRDTRGMIRQHQFNKVELVTVCGGGGLDGEFEKMLDQVRSLLMKLELPHREVALCKGDLGFSAAITHDFEVWMPSQQCYREISSVSYCGDFQGRRMNARYRGLDGQGKPSNEFLYTLNGSALAVGRTLVAVMENYQRVDGSIRIPTVLQDAMGATMITPQGDLT